MRDSKDWKSNNGLSSTSLLIRFIYYIYNYRLLYYLPMERMTATEWFMKAQIQQLEEENKKLKEKISELEDVSKDYDLLSKDFITLWEENEKLKSDLAYERTMLDNVRAEYKSLQNVIKKLKEELKETKET